jgi:hypothetical protein
LVNRITSSAWSQGTSTRRIVTLPFTSSPAITFKSLTSAIRRSTSAMSTSLKSSEMWRPTYSLPSIRPPSFRISIDAGGAPAAGSAGSPWAVAAAPSGAIEAGAPGAAEPFSAYTGGTDATCPLFGKSIISAASSRVTSGLRPAARFTTTRTSGVFMSGCANALTSDTAPIFSGAIRTAASGAITAPEIERISVSGSGSYTR